MTQYISLNVTLSNSQLYNLKPSMKDETEAALRLSSNMIVNSNDEINFPHKLLLSNRQVENFRKAFGNNSITDIRLSKPYQLFNLIQVGGFLSRLLGSLLKIGLRLMKNVIKPLAKGVLIPLGLTAAASTGEYLKSLRI